MNRVQIINKNEGWFGTECLIDGKKVPRLKAVDFHVAVDEVPMFKFETLGRPDIDVKGRTLFDFSPKNLSDACLIVLEELKKHGDFYNGFIASVKSVLKEGVWESDDLVNKKAEEIVQRITGEM